MDALKVIAMERREAKYRDYWREKLQALI